MLVVPHLQGFLTRRHFQFTYCEDMEDATDLSVTVIGGPGHGKSTLLRTIKASKDTLRWLRGDKKEEDRGAEDMATRTKGISVLVYTSTSGHTIHFRDLAGQQDFAAPHCMFHPSVGFPKAALIVTDSKLPVTDIRMNLLKSAGNLISTHDIGKSCVFSNVKSNALLFSRMHFYLHACFSVYCYINTDIVLIKHVAQTLH